MCPIDDCRFKIYINDVFLCSHQTHEIAESRVNRILSRHFISNCDIREIQITKEFDSPYTRRWTLRQRLYNTFPLSNFFETICKIDIRNVDRYSNRRNNSAARMHTSQ